MGNFEARLERERDRRDAELWTAHERGEHDAEPVTDCNRCWAAAKEAAGRPGATVHVTITGGPLRDELLIDEEGYVREPLSYENREGDPAFNGAFSKW